ncbi:hypothetical protein TraAM80_10586 [Trypanosoma rangeli]|uniref:Uncharacterized protein n=1 Tax=Trypanosoma rangeli TaxID=5698 RepID=A0A422MNK5_TRYRA|nr:uncharacterized protein TraAM80_10586 [Trypanosoma rangeli]RNE94799.1 hypothetical protein TraAM80_10586 [Trypanosoma rangeli]|eukprot:RNE94799.1 hypothetical protein TraAM80_10586 [Trypanosoma rangeli]
MRVRWMLACDAVPFEVHWHRRWQRMREELQDPAAVVGEEEGKGRTVQSLFGYPLATRVRCREEAYDGNSDYRESTKGVGAPPLFPVVAAAMPRVLFLDDAVARSDVRARRTLHGVHADVQRRQFVMKHDAAKDKNAQASVGG